MKVIDFSTMSVDPVGLKDRNGRVWKADPILSTLDALWLMERTGDELDNVTTRRLADLVLNCVKVYEKDATVEALLTAFRPADLLGILQAFLVHSGLLDSSTPQPPNKPTRKASKTS